MTNKIYIATYGSLKQGFYNHQRLGQNQTIIKKDKVTGYMFLANGYPLLFKNKPSENAILADHEIEIYEVTKEAEQNIDRIEALQYNKEIFETEINGKKETAFIYWTKPAMSNWLLSKLRPNGLTPIKAYTKELLTEKGYSHVIPD